MEQWQLEGFESWQEYYKDYLKSDHWRELSLYAKKVAGWQCEDCSKKGEPITGRGLEVHHTPLGYKNLRYERLQEGHIKVVCGDCHNRIHGIEDEVDPWALDDQELIDHLNNFCPIVPWGKLE